MVVFYFSLSGPVMDWRPVQGVPASLPMTTGIGSSPAANINWSKVVKKTDGWMELAS